MQSRTLEPKLDIKEKAENSTRGPISRRSFVKSAATVAAVAAAVPLQPLLGGKDLRAEASVIPYTTGDRARASFDFRVDAAETERIDIGTLPDNGDGARFSDHSALWHKSVLHDDMEIVNEKAWREFTRALKSGRFEDF